MPASKTVECQANSIPLMSVLCCVRLLAIYPCVIAIRSFRDSRRDKSQSVAYYGQDQEMYGRGEDVHKMSSPEKWTY
jgi:hypothetical protein